MTEDLRNTWLMLSILYWDLLLGSSQTSRQREESKRELQTGNAAASCKTNAHLETRRVVCITPPGRVVRTPEMTHAQRARGLRDEYELFTGIRPLYSRSRVALQVCFGCPGVGAYEYFRHIRRAGMVASRLRVVLEKMDCDELLDQLLKEETGL